jgi:hypothetical protein
MPAIPAVPDDGSVREEELPLTSLSYGPAMGRYTP